MLNHMELFLDNKAPPKKIIYIVGLWSDQSSRIDAAMRVFG